MRNPRNCSSKTRTLWKALVLGLFLLGLLWTSTKIALMDRHGCDYRVIPLGLWPQGKHDPTEYCPEQRLILVREDYDPVGDPHGWMVHERVHATLDKVGISEVGSYPHTNVEAAAYTAQFRHLVATGKCFRSYAELYRLMPWKFHAYGSEWAMAYWNEATKVGEG